MGPFQLIDLVGWKVAAHVQDTMVLETGIEQPEAIKLYQSSGYEPVEKFGTYADSPLQRCFGKRL